jgi:amino acid adenylation domain-containing protein/non-ribosomal peptide synthase protein (TIGR01720 family)
VTPDPQERLKRLLAQKGIRPGAGAAEPAPRPSGEAAPLSFAQERLWFLQRLEPASRAYHLGQSFRLRGPVDAGALGRAVDELLRRHEALRTGFVADAAGRACPEIAPAAAGALRFLDLTASPESRRAAAAAAAEDRIFSEPFDLTRPPLFRALLVTLAPQDHRVAICVHHLVFDGWSIGLLARELSALYAAGAAHRPAALPPLPLSYGDYAAWQRRRAAEPAWQAALGWWEKHLRALPPLELPTDRPRPARFSGRGAGQRFTVPGGVAARLRALAQREGTTLFAALLAAYETLLSRHAAQPDFGVGVSVAGRTHHSLEGLVGMFVNTVVFRADLAGDPSFAGLVRRVRAEALEVLARQETPFEQIVDRLRLERDLSRNPLFQAGLFLQNAPAAEFRLGSAILEPVAAEIRAAKFDLLVSLEEAPGGELRGSIEYSTDLFDAETIRRMGERYRALLFAAAADPEKRLSELSGLPPAEEAEIGRWSEGPSRDFPGDGWIHELPDRQPPTAVALSGPDGRRFTYAQFCGEAGRLARALRGLGAGPEVLVGVCLERSAELVIALHAVLRSGGAYVPLDPNYPAERLAWMAGDAGASIVVTTRALADRLPGCTAKMLFLEEPWPDGPATGPRPGGQNAAYMIYTSGSTGRPKGAINTHEAIRNMLRWIQGEFPLTGADVCLQKTPCSFDVSVREFFWPLLAGAELTVAEPGAHRDPARIAELIRQRGVTVVNFVPSVFRAFLEAPGVERCASLRLIFCTGEELPRDLVEKSYDRLRAGLHNLYGPTEAAVEFTHYACGRGEGPVPIGRPMANLEVQILDDAFHPVPRGVAGELYLGGVGLARGYHGRADLTADRWVPHPRKPGARLYRTGDLARWRPDGEIDYLGRTDFQVKLRGQRIELGEIEAVLREHATVREAAVVVREGRLVAYVVPRSGALATDELREWLSARLPEYMVPPSWVELGALPLNPAGKTDRKALPAPAAAAAGYEAPRGEREEMLAACWGEVLRVPQVGRSDGYFELGGDSILSIQLQARVRALGWDFELADLFQHQSLGALALALRPVGAAVREDQPAPFSLLRPEDRARLPGGLEDAYPLTALQAGMVLHAELNPGSAVYHEVFSYEVRAPWSEESLGEALRALARRHPVLRTSFALRGFSEPIQQVHAVAPIPLTMADSRAVGRDGRPRPPLSPGPRPAARLSLISGGDEADDGDRWIAAELARGFDWAEAPLWRARAQRRTDDSWEFTFSAHHAILDGWSAASLLAELFEEYLARAAGRPPAARPAPPPFARYVALERAALASVASRDFWAGQLAELTVGRLPRRPAGSAPPGQRRQASAWRAWRGAELAALQAVAARAGVALKHVLLAAHVKVAQAYTAQADVVTGVITNGRPEEAGAEETLGLFLNTLPLRMRLEPGTWLELIRAVFRAEEAASPHRRYPLAELQKGPERRALFDTTFNYVHYHGLDALRARPEIELLGARYFDENSFSYFAQYSLDTVRGELVFELRYDAGEFTAEQAEKFAEANRTALAALAAAPESRHAAVSVLSAGELAELLEAGRAAPLPPGAPRLLHDAFFASAARGPDAIALIDGSRRLTYAELAGRVRAWAARLRELGGGPERLVGVCLERGADLVTALLAVLESGAAYVPLDPSYPPERLAFICNDAEITLLVSRPELAGRLPAGSWSLVDAAELAALAPVPSALPQGATERAAGRSRPALPVPERAAGQAARRSPAKEGSRPALPTAEPANLAYLIYTSGSTGRPKAAAIEHRSACALLAWARAEYSAAEMAGTLAATSVCFDLSVFEIFATLAAGGKVILAENALALPGLPARDEVTLLNTVPSAAAELVRQRAIPPGVRVVNLAGEPLSAALADQLYATGTVAQVYDLYGPSEDTTYSTWARRLPGGPATIGRALPGTSLYLVDEYFQPVPPGAMGEIVLGGAGLARGYLGRPDLTAERFVPDPFAAVPGGRLYRTGDLARHRADGQLEFLGRADHQVKLRGFRIELGEIQSVLDRHPAVAESAVLARADAAGRPQLVAYVAGPAAAAVPEAEWRAWIAARLPEYFVPAVFVALPRLPRTPNGKLDRAALPAASWLGASAAAAGRKEPCTPDERALAQIWAGVLQLPAVGADDNFFALGGDSILALQVASRSRDAGLAVTPRLLFEYPTVATLAAAARISSSGSARAASALGAGTFSAAESSALDEGTLTPIQHWFFAQDFTEAHHWNQSVLLRSRVPLDPQPLEKAFAVIGERHPALSRRFERSPEGRWRTRAGEGPAFAFRSVHSEVGPGGRARPLAPSSPEGKLERTAGRDRPALPSSEDITAVCAAEQAALNLEHGPLARAIWFAGDAGDPGRLFIVIHHLAVDGVSWRILLEELWTAYEAAVTGGVPSWAAPTVSPGAWARWLQQFTAQGGFASEKTHWSSLAALPAEPLPRDLPDSENTVDSAGFLRVALTAVETESLLRRALAAHGCQINDLLLAALALALREWTGRESQVIHLEGHGREAAGSGLDFSRSVGWFTTLYPVRLDLRGATEATRALGAVQTQLAAVPGRGLGYGVGRFLHHPPLWEPATAEICFNYLGQFDGLVGPQAPFAPAEEAVGFHHSPRGTRAHGIDLNGLVTGGELRFEWHYPAARLRPATIARLAERHLAHLRALIAAAGTAARPPISGLSETELDRAISEIEL